MNITANGDYPVYGGIKGHADDQVNILMPAVVNGTVVIGYVDGADTFVPLEGDITAGALAAGAQYHLDHGWNPGLIFRVTDYTSEFEIALNGQT